MEPPRHTDLILSTGERRLSLNVLIIPDIHLKPWMLERARTLMAEGKAEIAVCLGDLPDDFGKQQDLDLYQRTFDAAVSFSREFPRTLWCCGNHDASYLWQKLETGYSRFAAGLCRKGIADLRDSLRDPAQFAFIHRIDKVLFMHGGLASAIVRENLPYLYLYGTIDAVISEINRFGSEKMWQEASPMWAASPPSPAFWTGCVPRRKTMW